MSQAGKNPPESPSPSHNTRLNRVRYLSYLLDERFRIPGTAYRVGLDGLLGLLPGIGDSIGMLLSAYILFEAMRMGIPRGIVLRMVANVALDTVIGAIPIAGDVFDIAWKANKKNAALLSTYLASHVATTSATPKAERGDRDSG